MSLSTKQIERFRKRLEKRRDELRQTLAQEMGDSESKNFSSMTGTVRDPGDESLAVQMSDFTITQSEKHMAELREVEAALQRIDDGVYGECMDCGGDIPLERLQAWPTATRCTDCQQRHENMRGGRDRTPSL